MNDILTYISTHVDSRGIPSIQNVEWKNFIQQYPKDSIKTALAEYISTSNIPFPAKLYSTLDFQDMFLKFCRTSMLSEYKDFDNVLEKVEYKYKYSDKPLGVIDKSHTYNIVSNYFQQENRMKCGSNLVDSPYNIWHDKRKLEQMNWHFWRLGALGSSDINDSTFRSAFRIGTYTATQFKPSVAKALYEKHDARVVLDTSCGWGDRLAGFYATTCTQTYVGCDPNPDVFETYKKQCIEYETLLGSKFQIVEKDKYFCCKGIKTVEIYNLPSEDMNWNQYKNYFDFYFTSPPYYETERYATDHASTQSWSRYPDFHTWKNNFFFKVNRLIWDTLKDDAFMMINIIEPRIHNGTRLNLCDDMVEDMLSHPNANYLGKIGMRMQARPHAIVDTEKNSVFIEPIWVFRKSNNTYIDTIFESLFK